MPAPKKNTLPAVDKEIGTGSIAAKVRRVRGAIKGQQAQGKGQRQNTYVTIADLEGHLQPLLQEEKISSIVRTIYSEGKSFIVHVIEDDEGNEKEYQRYEIPNTHTPQEYGSTQTYFRRYFQYATFGIREGNDDDGEGAKPKLNYKLFNKLSEELAGYQGKSAAEIQEFYEKECGDIRDWKKLDMDKAINHLNQRIAKEQEKAKSNEAF